MNTREKVKQLKMKPTTWVKNIYMIYKTQISMIYAMGNKCVSINIYKYIMTFLSYSLGYTTYITLEKLSLNTFVKTSSKRHRMISFYKLWEIQNIQLKWNHWKGFQLCTTADYFKIQSQQNVIKLILVTSKIPGFLFHSSTEQKLFLPPKLL